MTSTSPPLPSKVAYVAAELELAANVILRALGLLVGVTPPAKIAVVAKLPLVFHAAGIVGATTESQFSEKRLIGLYSRLTYLVN